jgi:hypothetical protein
MRILSAEEEILSINYNIKERPTQEGVGVGNNVTCADLLIYDSL